MRTDCITDTNFQGKLVISNRLTSKPSKCVAKVKDDIGNLVTKKDYNLYISQNYSNNEIIIKADYPFPLKPSQTTLLMEKAEEKLPVNAKVSRYFDAAKKVINDFETKLNKQYEKQWEQGKKQKVIQDIKDMAETVVFFPLFVVDDILHEINPKWSKKFEKLLGI